MRAVDQKPEYHLEWPNYVYHLQLNCTLYIHVYTAQNNDVIHSLSHLLAFITKQLISPPS